ncbi:hypothetical protein, partial [Glycocaulis alkaliphilus]|uniref:hypothetical protein n=1 Tax=Glycocaulis alkaliphilus TaxID=1434191 RepID=UPI001F2A7373
IPEPYLTYIQGYISSLSPHENYVAYVTQEIRYVSGTPRYVTVYNIAIGNILFDGQFSGDVDIYKIYSNTAYFNQFAYMHDANFVLNPESNLVYTDLTNSPYPDIAPERYDKYLFYAIVAILIFSTITLFWRYNYVR